MEPCRIGVGRRGAAVGRVCLGPSAAVAYLCVGDRCARPLDPALTNAPLACTGGRGFQRDPRLSRGVRRATARAGLPVLDPSSQRRAQLRMRSARPALRSNSSGGLAGTRSSRRPRAASSALDLREASSCAGDRIKLPVGDGRPTGSPPPAPAPALAGRRAPGPGLAPPSFLVAMTATSTKIWSRSDRQSSLGPRDRASMAFAPVAERQGVCAARGASSPVCAHPCSDRTESSKRPIACAFHVKHCSRRSRGRRKGHPSDQASLARPTTRGLAAARRDLGRRSRPTWFGRGWRESLNRTNHREPNPARAAAGRLAGRCAGP